MAPTSTSASTLVMFSSSTCRSIRGLLMAFLAMQLFWHTLLALTITGSSDVIFSKLSCFGSSLVPTSVPYFNSSAKNRLGLGGELPDLSCGGHFDQTDLFKECLNSALSKYPISDNSDEYYCKRAYMTTKCRYDTICKYCPLHEILKDVAVVDKSFEENDAKCRPWEAEEQIGCADWPSRKERNTCLKAVNDDLKECQEMIHKKYPNGDDNNAAGHDQKERQCKSIYEGNQCYMDAYCRHCDKKTDHLEFRIITEDDLAKVKDKCQEWFYLEPKMECLIATTHSSVLMIVGIVFGVIVLIVIIAVIVVVCICMWGKSDGGRSKSRRSSRPKSKRSKSKSRMNSSRIGSRMGHSKVSSKASSKASRRLSSRARTSRF